MSSEPAPTADSPPALDVGQTTGRTVIAGSSWTVATRVVPQLATLAVSVAAARYLGPDDLGRQTFIAFVSLSLAALVSDGISNSLTRQVGTSLGHGDDGTVLYLLVRAWRIQAVAAALAAASLVLAAFHGASPQGAWVAAAAVCGFVTLHAVPSSLLGGMQRWRAVSIVGLVTSTLAVPATIAVLGMGGGVTGFFVVEAVLSFAGLAVTSLLARRAKTSLVRSAMPHPQAVRAMLVYAAYATAFSVVTLVVWRKSELIFLQYFSTDREVAFYSISFAAVAALAVVPQALALVALPAFATLHGAGEPGRIADAAARAVRLLIAATLPLTAAAIALGPAAIELAYGRDYVSAAPVLRLMLSAFPVMSLYLFCASLLYALGRVRVQLVISIVAALVNVGLDLMLIPGHGAVAAAVANLGGQMCAALPIALYAWRVTDRRRWWSGSLAWMAFASAVGGLAAAAVVAIGGARTLPLAAVAGLVAFGTVAALAPLLERRDAVWLEQALGGRARAAIVPLLRRLAKSS